MNFELIELKKQFSAWRQSKTSRVTPVPPELRGAVVAQLSHYSLSKLCSGLSLSRVIIPNWQAVISVCPELDNFKSRFKLKTA